MRNGAGQMRREMIQRKAGRFQPRITSMTTSLHQIEAKDADALDAVGIVAAPFQRRHLVGPDAAELQLLEKSRRALFAGACEYVFEFARLCFLDDLFDQL